MNQEVIVVHQARRIAIAAALLLIACVAFNSLAMASATMISPRIRIADYNIVNTGSHPITPAMIFPNDTAWKDPDVECLIITNQTFAAAFQPLADLKTGRGVYTAILTVESIYSDARFNTSGPLDPTPHAAYIRNAIKHYHYNNGTEFVVLGGDVGVIPTRYVYNPDTDESAFPLTPINYRSHYKPTDHYYAGLEGTWDNDGDGKFGEMGIVGQTADEVDWTAEVFVGRMPASSVPQVQALVQKVIDYETSPPAGSWANSAVFAGAVSQYGTGGDPPVDEAELSEYIIDSYFGSMTPDRLYDHTPGYVPPSPYTDLSETNLRNAWNAGASIVNLAGHGAPTLFTGDGVPPAGLINAAGAGALTNGGELPFVYIFSCSSGAFDYDEITGVSNSLSEELVLNANGGAIAVVSAARTTYYFTVDPLFEALNEGQNRFFWREFMVKNEYQPGRALYLSQESYIDQFINKYWNVQLNHDPELAADPSYLGQEEKFRKNLLAYNLLGDPELWVYTNTPRVFAPDIFGPNASIGDTLVLEITDDMGMPVPGARILLNGSGYYITARANAQGIASVRIPYDPALVGSYLNFTLAGHNMNATRGSIPIIEDTQAPISLQVEVPSDAVDYRASLIINASGTDLGTGLRYAFIVVVGETGGATAIYAMTRTRVEGNGTSFTFKYPGALSPGQTILFYAIAFDASGNYVIATPAQDQLYTVTITSRLVETIMLGVLAIGMPAAVVLILLWFVITRRRHIQRASVTA
ncbi:MAG: hypothetical protein JW839_09230 [Candidatus Lokiarchaeota archaeon]|nr:hypothetical protein [Candidatus Lokiarchaeota archaeon]